MQKISIDKLKRVLSQIVDYRAGEIRLNYLVNAVEGTLLSMEEPLPKDFLSAWQRVYINLETIYALDKESVLRNKINEELGKLETVISNFLANQEDEPAD